MKYWSILPDTNKNYTQILPTNEFYNNKELYKKWYFDIGTKPEGEDLVGFEMKKKNKSKKIFNIPWFFNRVILADETALSLLSDILEKNNVEILNINCDDKPLFVINYLTRFTPEEVLDLSKSEVERFKGTQEIKNIRKFYFKESAVRNKDIFSVSSITVVSDNFKKIIEDNKLTGLIFELLWNSETDI